MSEKWAMRILMLFVVTITITGACSVFNGYVGIDDDHVLEEMSEELIRAKTGMELDLTPDSKESN